ncbi:uncharacterized protein LOC5504805 [Nematostella vectensis]|uniref:uncharacterized protein LOC5504805 n=1 Tax=Nematostella vectensis TaxID=45351 RepID=UPI0020779892|nr:uncharacterized protein LOC5504805 [Nematostella vectensis]
MDGGSRMWCFVSALLCVVSFLADTLAIKLRLQERKWMRSMFFTGMCAGCLAATIVSIGFKSWCGSFTINSCWYNNKQDWHFFTPKFSDCYGAFYWFLAITICLWFSLLLKSLVLFCYKWNRHIVMTTSS